MHNRLNSDSFCIFSLFPRNSSIKYIDVWPVNFLQPTDQDPFDTSSLFMLQLACIINMVPVWKNLHLRVFQCENIQNDSNLSIAETSGSTNEFPKSFNEHKLRDLLNILRISASINQVSEWPRLVDKLGDTSTTFLTPDNDYPSTTDQTDSVSSGIPESYLYR